MDHVLDDIDLLLICWGMGVIMVFGYIRECPNSEKLHTEVLRMFAVYSQMVQKKWASKCGNMLTIGDSMWRN